MKKLFQLEIILSIFKLQSNHTYMKNWRKSFVAFYGLCTEPYFKALTYIYIFLHVPLQEKGGTKSFVMTGTRIRWANAKQKMKVSKPCPDLKEVCVFWFRCVKSACIVNWLNDPNPYYHHMSMRYWIGDHFQTFRVWLPCELWWVT